MKDQFSFLFGYRWAYNEFFERYRMLISWKKINWDSLHDTCKTIMHSLIQVNHFQLPDLQYLLVMECFQGHLSHFFHKMHWLKLQFWLKSLGDIYEIKYSLMFTFLKRLWFPKFSYINHDCFLWDAFMNNYIQAELFILSFPMRFEGQFKCFLKVQLN